MQVSGSVSGGDESETQFSTICACWYSMREWGINRDQSRFKKFLLWLVVIPIIMLVALVGIPWAVFGGDYLDVFGEMYRTW